MLKPHLPAIMSRVIHSLLNQHQDVRHQMIIIAGTDLHFHKLSSSLDFSSLSLSRDEERMLFDEIEV